MGGEKKKKKRKEKWLCAKRKEPIGSAKQNRLNPELIVRIPACFIVSKIIHTLFKLLSLFDVLV